MSWSGCHCGRAHEPSTIGKRPQQKIRTISSSVLIQIQARDGFCVLPNIQEAIYDLWCAGFIRHLSLSPLLLKKGRNLTMTSNQSRIETSAVVLNKIAWFVEIARRRYIGSQYRRREQNKPSCKIDSRTLTFHFQIYLKIYRQAIKKI